MKRIKLFRNIPPLRRHANFSRFFDFFGKVIDDLLVYSGTIIAFAEKSVEKRFHIKHFFLYIVTSVVIIFTWAIFFLVGDKVQENPTTKEKIYSFKPNKPSLFPLADYYLFDNKPHVDKTDLIVKPKLKIEDSLIKKNLLKDIHKVHHLFIKKEKVIKKEMSKFNK